MLAVLPVMFVPEAHCECVIWREGSHRCELWTVGESARLRLFDADNLVHEEPFAAGAGWDRAIDLRPSRARARRLVAG